MFVSLSVCLSLCFYLGFSYCGVLVAGGNADSSLFNIGSGFLLEAAGCELIGKANRLIQIL